MAEEIVPIAIHCRRSEKKDLKENLVPPLNDFART
jgi:hypothetical protein